MSIRRYLFPLSLLLVLCLASVGAVSAGLFDQILEKGKDAVKKETQKEVDKGIDQILRPGQEPQRGKPSPKPQKSVAPPSEDLASREVGPPKLKKALGLPIISSSAFGSNVLTKAEELEVRKFFDYVDLGTMPGLFDAKAACFVADYLPPSEWPKYVQTHELVPDISESHIQVFKRETHNYEKWKGKTEFEKRRTRESFLNEYREKFMAAAVKLPIELVVVQTVRLPEYNFDRNAFVFDIRGQTNPLKGNGGNGMEPDLNLRLCSDPAPLSFKQTLPTSWTISPTEAEQLLQRVPARQVFFASVVELRDIPGSKPDPKLVQKYGYALLQRYVAIKSQALYEDADLTRPLHTFAGPQGAAAASAPPDPERTDSIQAGTPSAPSSGETKSSGSVSTPAESVLITGIPETIPTWKQVVLNNETLLLLLLKHQGDDRFGPKTWDLLARAQLKNDGEYYQGEKYYNNLTGHGLEWGMKWDPQVDGGYHPTYIPFTPPNFGDRGSQSVFNDDTMQRFKAWTVKRAAALSNTLLLTGFFTQQRNHRTHQFEPFFHIGDFGRTEQNRPPKMFSSPELKKYSPQQMYITTVSLGEGFPKDVGIVFPAEIAGYAPRPSPSDIVRLFGDGSSTSSPPILRSELEVTVVNLEVVPPVKQTGGLRQHEPEFLFHVRPSNVKVYAKGDKEVLYEQDYSAAVSSSPQTTGPIASEGRRHSQN